MARVTVEDCVLQVPNRFELVMLAAQRARNISAGAPLTIELDNDKMPVVSLREIADQTVVLGDLENGLVKGLQKVIETDEPEDDDPELDLLEGDETEGSDSVIHAPAPDGEPDGNEVFAVDAETGEMIVDMTPAEETDAMDVMDVASDAQEDL